jgi:ParB family chromosome partitioning protein
MSQHNPSEHPGLASDRLTLWREVAEKASFGSTQGRSPAKPAERGGQGTQDQEICDIDPQFLDVSFAADRLSEIDNEYKELRQAIRDHGQTSPILVRPNPHNPQRYMVVFGHRRARVAMDLGIAVRAVIKNLTDTESAIAQGQENAARSNLSFIERAYFAQNLLSNGMTRQVVKSAIGIDDTMLSRMLGVVETIPSTIIMALGASKKIGRDKWLSLRQLILNPAYLTVATERLRSDHFLEIAEEDRFDALHAYLKKFQARSTAKAGGRSQGIVKNWSAADKSVAIAVRQRPNKVAFELSKSDARAFGEWLSENLQRFHDEYRQTVARTG